MKLRLFGRDSVDNQGGENEAAVSRNGEVITRPFDYSTFDFQTINIVDTAFNHFKPEEGKQFVITGITLSGNRDIGVNGAVFTLYTASTATSTVVLATAIELEIPKSTIHPFVVPNVIIADKVFLNSKADDTTVRAGVFGYFVPKVS